MTTAESPPRLLLHMRQTVNNPNHHLWNNNGRWWMYFTIVHPDGKSKRNWQLYRG